MKVKSNRIKLLKNLNKAIDSLKMHVTPTIEEDLSLIHI